MSAKKVGLDDFLVAGGSIDELIANAVPYGGGTSREPKRPSIADEFLKLILSSGVELWRDSRGNSFATYPVGGHYDHARIVDDEGRTVRSAFVTYCESLYFKKVKRSVPSDAKLQAFRTLHATALNEGETYLTAVRIGHFDGAIYHALGNESREVVKIRADGWTIIPNDESPIRFILGREVMPMPKPGSIGDWDALRELLNVSDDGFELIRGFIVGAFLPVGTFPVLSISGEQGSGKSFACKVVRQIVDRNGIPLRSLPRDPSSLASAVRQNHVLAFENVSLLPPWLSDALCAVASGQGIATRELYSNGDEFVTRAHCPIVMNGIPDLLGRPDLADRSLAVALERLQDAKEEGELLLKFELNFPRILNALYSDISRALKHRASDRERIRSRVRLLDLAQFVTDSEAEDRKGAFLKVHKSNRKAQAEGIVETDLFAMSLIRLLEAEERSEFTAGELLQRLNVQEGHESGQKKPADWPKNPRAVNSHLKRIGPELRAVGIEFVIRRTNRGSEYSFRDSRNMAAEPSLPPLPSLNDSLEPDSMNLPGDDNDWSGDDGHETSLVSSLHVCAESRSSSTHSDSSDGSDGTERPLHGTQRSCSADIQPVLSDDEGGVEF